MKKDKPLLGRTEPTPLQPFGILEERKKLVLTKRENPGSGGSQTGLRLVKAVRQMSSGQVEELLNLRHINVNTQDEDGMTPLHHAAALGARPCIRLLVNSGRCDYLIRDNQGRYAFELAIEWARDYAVGRLLAKKQAQQAAAQGVPAYVPRG